VRKSPGSSYDYGDSRDKFKTIAEPIKAAMTTPGMTKTVAFFNNHARANTAAKADHAVPGIMGETWSHAPEGMVVKFLQIVQAIGSE
jgi:hypothetical protein